MILAVAPQGPVMVTWANFHYLDFVLNWVAHVDALGIKPLVGAMDDKILQARTFVTLASLQHLAFPWHSQPFACVQQTFACTALEELNVNPILCDCGLWTHRR